MLILGGTAEARALATELVAAGLDVTSSLAGRVARPALPRGRVRIGGFGGADGLAAHLAKHRVAVLIDATHPFAGTISTSAVRAAAAAGVPLIRLERPGWADHPDAGRWTWVDDAAAAVEAGAGRLRPFLTTGRGSLADFAAWAERDVLVRVVDPLPDPPPPRWRVVTGRGPYTLAGERALLREHRSDLLVTKDSGGALTAAKLAAARELDVAVIVLRRPSPPPAGAYVVDSVAQASEWIQASCSAA